MNETIELHFNESQASVTYLRTPWNLLKIHYSFMHSKTVSMIVRCFLQVRPIARDF